MSVSYWNKVNFGLFFFFNSFPWPSYEMIDEPAWPAPKGKGERGNLRGVRGKSATRETPFSFSSELATQAEMIGIWSQSVHGLKWDIWTKVGCVFAS